VEALLPENFVLSAGRDDEFLAADLRRVVKSLFDASRAAEEGVAGFGRVGTGKILELSVDGFHHEQIWAMIAMENDSVLRVLNAQVKKLLHADEMRILEAKEDDLEFQEEEKDISEASSPMSSSSSASSTSSSSSSESDDSGARAVSETEEKTGTDENLPTEMDDDFFRFADMEKFTESMEEDDALVKILLEEKKKNKRVRSEEDDDNISFVTDDAEVSDDDDGGVNIMYEGFWGKRRNGDDSKKKALSKRRKLSFVEEEAPKENENKEEEEEEKEQEKHVEKKDVEQNLSTYEKHKLEMKEKIAELEEELLMEKPWELTGEVQARKRPENSLLEKGAEMEVDYLMHPAPVITEEATKTVEDLIRQRIIDQDFDDVQRRLPIEKDADYRKEMELSTEKSKVGLGEEYAKEYEERVMGHTPVRELSRSKEEQELHDMFTSLCQKFDALSNFHFTPKPPKPSDSDAKPENVSSIAMEDATPIAAGQEAQQITPEELLATKKGKEGLGKSREEMEQNERKRLRQARKTAKRKRKRQADAEKRIVSKLNPGLGNKHAKVSVLSLKEQAAASSSSTSWSKSSRFFQKLQQGGELASDRKGEEKSKKRGHLSAQVRL